jgi:hypothetical protein
MSYLSRVISRTSASSSSHGGGPQQSHLLFLLILLVPSLYVCGMSIGSGEFWWTDESRHAMDGVFVLDFVRDFPWHAPMDYVVRYFAQYPALALNWYPPAFYAIEAIFFGLLGITETAAHLSVLTFLTAGLVAFFLWAGRLWGYRTALVAGLLIALSPEFVFWGRSVMLEIPAIAMMMVSTLLFDGYLRNPRLRTATLAGASLAAMLLVKQSTAFLLPALLIYAWLTRRGRLLVTRQSLLACLLVVAALTFLLLHAIIFGGHAIGAWEGNRHEAGGMPPTLSLARWIVFPHTVLEELGWPLFLAAILGTIATFRTPRKPQDLLLILWLASWYLMDTLLFASNAARYTVYALPALALLACHSVDLVHRRTWRYALNALLAGVVAWQLWHALTLQPLFVSGYRAAALNVLSQPVRGTIMFAGKHDGDFIFHLRANDPDRRQVVVRADKTLVTINVHKYFGMQSHVSTVGDVRNLLDQYKVGWVVLERPDIVGVKEFQLLWQAVNGTGFRLERDIAVDTNVPEYRGLHILLFRRVQTSADPGTVRIEVMGREVEFAL